MLTGLVLFCALNGPTCCRDMAALAAKPAFMALHDLPVQTDFAPKLGHMQSVAGANDFVVPASKGVRGGVLMVHEWWGLNSQIKSTAEKLHAATGLGIVAIDLYHGQVATTREDASKYMQSVKEDEAGRQVQATLDAMRATNLLGRPMKRIGSIGYCFGGGWSLMAALQGGKKVDACVMYYGHPELDQASLAKLHAPVLGFFGNLDTGITPKLVDEFVVAMRKAGKHLSVHRYNAVHAFANPSNPKYDPAATADAWKYTVAFFKRRLL